MVLKNILQHREAGEDVLEAAASGAEEVAGAITASTTTTIAVFAPIVYVEGVAGELFRDLSLAIAFSLLASLLVALTLLPAWAGRFGAAPRAIRPVAAGARSEPVPGGIVRRAAWLVRALSARVRGAGSFLRRLFTPALDAFDRGFAVFAARYHRVLEWSLDRRGTVLRLAGAALVVSLAVGVTLRRDLLPDVDQGAFEARVELPAGTGLEATAAASATLEQALGADPGVDAVFSRIGRDVRAYGEGEETTDLNSARLQVRVGDGHASAAVMDRFRPVAAGLVGATVTLQAGQVTTLGRILGGEAADIAVRVRGEDLGAAHARAAAVAGRLAGLELLGNVRIGSERGTPELRVEILRDPAAWYGIDPRAVAEAVDRAMHGERATDFVDFDRKIAVMVRYPEPLRSSRTTLETLRVEGVPRRELVLVEEVIGPAEVRREDQGRVVTVYTDVTEGGLDAAIAAVQDELRVFPAERALRLEVGGENEEMRRSFRELLLAFALAVVLVYMVLAAQFESFALPFTILMAVPLALVGALAAAGLGINTMSLIGVVILVGIVDNDAIVKIDFIQQARAGGASVRAAILEAGRARLRPILMTTATTVLGLLPMALGFGRGADLQAPLAIAVIGGLLVATLLTLSCDPGDLPGDRGGARPHGRRSGAGSCWSRGGERRGGLAEADLDPTLDPPPRGRHHGICRRGGAGRVLVEELPD